MTTTRKIQIDKSNIEYLKAEKQVVADELSVEPIDTRLERKNILRLLQKKT
jgi:hypothetical protein